MEEKLSEIIQKLASTGWKEVILEITQNQINIDQESWSLLLSKLVEPIDFITRNHEGLLDYSNSGNQLITPYDFSKSLLIHCLSNPLFKDNRIDYYPSIEEIEIIENLVFSSIYFSNPRTLQLLKDEHGDSLVIGVFSYQYNVAERTCHFKHADMNYSRTGISRVGNNEVFYDPINRSYEPTNQENGIRVMPARFGTFLCLKLKGNESSEFIIMDQKQLDANLEFLFPIHKLFSGNECLLGSNIEISYNEYHRNEKLNRVHNSEIENTIPINGYDLADFPFVIDNNTKQGFLNSAQVSNSNCIIIPTASPLAEPAIQSNRYVQFIVPSVTESARFSTSLAIPAKIIGQRQARQAPEYVNIRNIVKQEQVIDRNEDVQNISNLSEEEFVQKIGGGSYNAIDFIDRTADGFVNAITNLELKSYSAYSLITAPDYFPYVNQRDIFKYNIEVDKFDQGGADPLSDGRIKANINYDTFKNDLNSLTAIVGMSSSEQISNLNRQDIYQASFLPDAASSIYAPGWDISMDIDTETNQGFNAAYGLGSPFPEDAKLCAALNSYWPAAAPDASRTFFRSKTYRGFPKQPTAIPLTDFELGIHPLLADQMDVDTNFGWDGEHGPFFEIIDEIEYVNYCDIARSDYSFNFWQGKIGLNSFNKITTTSFISRMNAMKKCISELPPFGDTVKANRLWLVSFVQIIDWTTEPIKIDPTLIDKGYQFIFAEVNDSTIVTTNEDIKRLRVAVSKKYICQMDQSNFFWEEQNLEQLNNFAAFLPKVNYISLNDIS